MKRAVWIGDGDIPRGTAGLCWPCEGFDDPESAQEGAYSFSPDGADYAVYCDPRRDLEIGQ